MVKKVYNGYRADDFNGFLDNLRETRYKHITEKGIDFMLTYLYGREPLLDKEQESYPNCQCICFRVPGYTIGHMIVTEDDTIVFLTVYNRPENNIFTLSCEELEIKLRDNFLNKKLN